MVEEKEREREKQKMKEREKKKKRMHWASISLQRGVHGVHLKHSLKNTVQQDFSVSYGGATEGKPPRSLAHHLAVHNSNC